MSFPQYGFKREFDRDLHPPGVAQAFTPRRLNTRFKSRSRKRATSRTGTFVQAALSPSDRTLPSRGPWLASGLCCPAGSMLTMTSSEALGPSGPTYQFAVRSYPGREIPQFTLPVCFLRAVFRTPADQTTALGCFFIARFGLPRLCRGSASTSPRVPVPAWPCNEAAKFALCYGPEELLALHRPGRLRSSFHLQSRLTKASNITTRVNQPIPAAGLAPARQAALWAANRDTEKSTMATRSAHTAEPLSSNQVMTQTPLGKGWRRTRERVRGGHETHKAPTVVRCAAVRYSTRA